MMERWADVAGFEGRYEVSDLGRLRSLLVKGRRRSHPLIIKDYALPAGYRFARLFDGDGYRNVYVHRAVLTAFVGEPAQDHQCAHLDGDCTNNRLNNLAWTTVAENHAHKVAHGTTLRGERGSSCKLPERYVIWIRELYEPGSPVRGQRALADRFGVSQGHISDIVNERRWAHDGGARGLREQAA